MRVFIYWNLHRKCFSVKALAGPDKGRVVAHLSYFELVDATFKVSEAGRQRVLREKRKNVHAGVVGTLVEQRYAGEVRTPVMYNPYTHATFRALQPDGLAGQTWQAVSGARLVMGSVADRHPRMHAIAPVWA